MLDPQGCEAEKLDVAGKDFSVCVGPVGQERKVDVAVRIRQVMHFEESDLLFRLGFVDEKGRYRHEGPQR